MYVQNHKARPGKVTVVPHSSFARVTTALKLEGDGVTGDGPRTYVYENYDELVDCPIEVGNQIEFDFDAAGVQHHVAIYGTGNHDVEALKVDMAKVVESSTGIFGQNPNEEYTFIIHNVVDGQGGLEHTNSTVLSVNRWTYSGKDYVDFLAENKCDIIGVPTGFPKYDEAIGGGLRRKCVDLVSARPKVGKSVFADNVALNTSRQGIPRCNRWF